MKIETHFFKELELIYKKHNFLKSKEEKFNIFSVLYKEHDEKKLHSRFIAALLDPFASHEIGYTFINEFLKTIKKENLINNYQNAVVYPEEWNKKEYKNIDILIIDKKSKNAIIIENKIYAGDSNNEETGQLERYFLHVRDNEQIPQENIITFYLTLDGHEPSNESLGQFEELQNINGFCISYPDIIIPWLTNSLKYVVDKPFIRETIFQYQTLIKKMTQNDTEIQERIEIRDKIGESESSMSATKYLIDNFKHVKWHTVYDFWADLEQKLIQKGFKIESKPTEENITDITHYETYRKGQKDKQECGIKFKYNNEILIWVWNEADDWLYWGAEDNENTNEKYRQLFEKYRNDNKIEYSDAKNWWKFCFEDDKKNIWLSNFSHDGTFNLINREYREKITTEIVEEITNYLKINEK